jgi:hypothetical protein
MDVGQNYAIRRDPCGPPKLIAEQSRCRVGHMNREKALKIALVFVGILFLALTYPLIVFVRQDPSMSMMFSLYVTLGVFLLLAIRNPLANRSLIAFTAWSSLAHAALMGTQAMRDMVPRGELGGVAMLIIIGIALIALAPAKEPASVLQRSQIHQPG